MTKAWKKKQQDELTEYLQFRRRGSVVPSKKGKGSYIRNPKHKNATSFLEDPPPVED